MKAGLRVAAAVFLPAACGFVPLIASAEITSADVNRDGATLHVTWTAPAPVDVWVAARADAPPQERRLAGKADADGRIDLPASAGRVYVLLDGAGDEVWTSERVIPLSGGSNFRDLGGYRTADGHRVKWGLLYRSAAMNNLTPQDLDLLSVLGVRTVCDLRSRQERMLAPDRVVDVRTVANEYEADLLFQDLANAKDPAAMQSAVDRLYTRLPKILQLQLQSTFRSLVDGEVPLAVHCSAGQDRTGLVSGLILAALGVPRQAIMQDYLLSNSLRRPANEKPSGDLEAVRDTNSFARFVLEQKAAAAAGHPLASPRPLYAADGRPQLAVAFDAIEAEEGSIEHYLECELNVGPTELDILRRRYLDPPGRGP